MATYKLTPKEPDAITGFQNPLMGWHFTGVTALDVFTSFAILDEAGWDYHMFKNPDDHMLQRMSLTKQVGEGTQPVQFIINDTQWYALDGNLIQVIDENDVNDNYVVTTWSPPPFSWTATTAAPTATALPATQATVVFAQPLLMNANFVYTASQVNGQTTTPIPVIGQPTVDGSNNVTLTVGGLSEVGDEVTIIVTVTYRGGVAHSVASNSITVEPPALDWAATATEPTATALTGLKASLVFAQPVSDDGPFTYTVLQTDQNQTASAATLVGDPVIDDNGNVTLTAGDLAEGSEYTFIVTVTYINGTAPSVPSNSITAIN